MQKNTAKEKLKAGEIVYGSSLTECFDAEIAILLKAAGLDFFFTDTEHSTADYHDIQGLCRAARGAGIIPMVRVTDTVPFLITRALDVGAMGIVVPRVHSAAQARTVVDAMKYPPEGTRGFGMRGIITDFQWTNAEDEMASANHETLTVVQIESQAGLDHVEEIAGTPGLDVLFVGPYDLTISMGIAEQFRERTFWSAVDRVVAACERNGIAAGLQTGDKWIFREAQKRGVRFLLYSNDVTVLFEGYRDAIAELKKDILSRVTATEA
ncbi:MAG TPA: aldolase/citrate lyase family protein [Bryobacteraceae bacterium]|jgi:2-keto-3-deoxy-L-rhamnonate aldolase RhmA|nr:aldolase/citrate lyase family protein [Bryobacteraceae bacterium]